MVGGKRAIAAYFGAVPTYAMVYGAFATLPIFLVWIYLSWVIVLLGAVIAAYAPLRRQADRPAGPTCRAPISTWRSLVLARLAQARGRRNAAAADAKRSRRAIGIDPLQVDACSRRWSSSTGSAGSRSPAARATCCCAIRRRTPAEPLVAKLLLEPAPELAPVWKRAGFDTAKLGEWLPVAPASA